MGIAAMKAAQATTTFLDSTFGVAPVQTKRGGGKLI